MGGGRQGKNAADRGTRESSEPRESKGVSQERAVEGSEHANLWSWLGMPGQWEGAVGFWSAAAPVNLRRGTTVSWEDSRRGLWRECMPSHLSFPEVFPLPSKPFLDEINVHYGKRGL